MRTAIPAGVHADQPIHGVPLGWEPKPGDLPRQFASRQAQAQELGALFPDAPGDLSPVRGGRSAALELLEQIHPTRYGKSRNYLDGAVTRLSPYIRHGVLTLVEVRDAVLHRTRERGSSEKLINELGWRDYWQRLWHQLGEGIWSDQEPLKTGHTPESYGAELPIDIAGGRTGLACMDSFIAELHSTGWLHNHARMWLAAYVVHWRRIRWQVGAAWFLLHLLDGDPASNNLSWQWVASCFSHKPYFFNRANLERYSGGEFCHSCALNGQGCPLDASYEELEARLFHPMPAMHSGADRRRLRQQSDRRTNPATLSRPARRQARPR
jgi:deoxyribodipyrimidine photo-lyase